MKDSIASKAFWREYLRTLPPSHPHRAAQPEAFAFGGGDAALANELAELVLSGKKRGTASLAVEFTAVGEALPRAGDVAIVLDGRCDPAALIEFTNVATVAFDAVDDAFAATEGEGDGSLAHWRRAHVAYFNGVCLRLGGTFDGQTPVICQTFRVLRINT